MREEEEEEANEENLGKEGESSGKEVIEANEDEMLVLRQALSTQKSEKDEQREKKNCTLVVQLIEKSIP